MFVPLIGIILGDSAGIGPELVAKTAASGILSEQCRPVIIGDSRIFCQGMNIAKVDVPYYTVEAIDEIDDRIGIPILDTKDQPPEEIIIGRINNICGIGANRVINLAVDLCIQGKLDGICYAPLNRRGLRITGCAYENEIQMIASRFGSNDYYNEISFADGIWMIRVTSHMPISMVSECINVSMIKNAISFCNDVLLNTGCTHPRIGVAALNPHCGEEGLCGIEEIDKIEPAIWQACQEGVNVCGPITADTLFEKAFGGEFDGIITMYHDQAQIALKMYRPKLWATAIGNLPVPVTTCICGTAYDIAGKGVANQKPFENAVRLVSKLASPGYTSKNLN